MTDQHRHPADPLSSTGPGPSREQLLDHGARAEPWRFVPEASGELERSPEDHLIRLLLGANLARLGLRTPALEHLRRLLATPDLDPRLGEQARALVGAAQSMPDDRIGTDERIARAGRTLGALAGHSLDDATGGFEAWRERTGAEEWFATLDGNIVRRNASTGAWIRFANDRALASSMSPGRGIDPEKPLYIGAMDPAWVALRGVELLGRAPNGWWAPIVVVEPDPMAFLDGIAGAECQGALNEERLRLFVGERAFDHLETYLDERDAFLLSGSCVTGRPDRADVARRIASTVSQACARQAERADALRGRLGERHRDRDAAHWADRYDAQSRPADRPLRVLIPTTRLSTFVQHAAGDAARAFGALGCDARLLIEPDASTKLSSVAFLREIDRFDPDLVVLINYTRSTLAKDLPRDVPLVTWVQDAMFHLFSESAWSGRGPRDFVYGHLHRDFFDRFGVPRSHARPAFVPASEDKFHAAPLDDATRERFACDIAMMTNHSETPEALLARFLSDAAANPTARRLVEAVEPRVRAIVADAMGGSVFARLEGASRDTLGELGLPTDDASVARLLDQVVYPFADRLMRHEAAHWAADLAEAHGWSLRLYGAGWERHPRLGRYASGTLDHAEPLRAAYQAARTTLHVSLHGYHHQRVVECALSGGAPLARRTGDTVDFLRKHTVAAVSRDNDPSHSLVSDRSAWSFCAEDARAMKLAAQLQRLGLRTPRRVFHDGRARDPEPASRILAEPVAWLMGDLAETTFDSRPGLEMLVERSAQLQGWRASISGGIAARARERLTYDAAAAEILRMTREALCTRSASRGPTAPSAAPDAALAAGAVA